MKLLILFGKTKLIICSAGYFGLAKKTDPVNR